MKSIPFNDPIILLRGFIFIAAFQSWVIRNFGIVKAQLNQMQESLDAVLYSNDQSQSSRISVEPNEKCFKLPMKTTEDFNNLVTEVKDLKIRKLLVRYYF